MHFSAIIYMARYLHQFSAVVKKMQWKSIESLNVRQLVTFYPFSFLSWKKREEEKETDFGAIWNKFAFGAKKQHIKCPITTFLVHIMCRFNAHYTIPNTKIPWLTKFVQYTQTAWLQWKKIKNKDKHFHKNVSCNTSKISRNLYF